MIATTSVFLFVSSCWVVWPDKNQIFFVSIGWEFFSEIKLRIAIVWMPCWLELFIVCVADGKFGPCLLATSQQSKEFIFPSWKQYRYWYNYNLVLWRLNRWLFKPITFIGVNANFKNALLIYCLIAPMARGWTHNLRS